MRPALTIAAALAAIAAPLLAPAPALARRAEVTRFHTPETLARLGDARVAVVAAPGTDAAGLETAIWLAAVERALPAPQLALAAPDGAQVFAEVRVEQRTWRVERNRGGVSVGVGGSTGGYGSGVGLGIGIDLSGPPPEQLETTLSVTLRDKASGQALWEGRAVQTVKAKSKDADPTRAADKLARALFTGFPGRSGETISVK